MHRLFNSSIRLALGLAPLLLTAHPAQAQTYKAGAGLTLSGNTFSIATGGVTGSMIGLPLSLSASSSSPILTVTNTGSGYGIKTVSTSGTGTYGTNTKYGNVGTLGDINGFGVYGSTAAGPYPYGVYGINRASGNGDFGIVGGVEPVSGSKNPVGVFGSDASSANGFGVYGLSTNSFGVYGSSAGGVGTYGTNTKYGNHGTLGDVNGFGVYGSTSAGPYPYGVYGINRASGNGDYGFLGGVDPVYKTYTGVFGSDTSSSGGNGVFGDSTNGSGVAGVSTSGYGVFASSTSSVGVLGNSTGSDGVQGNSGDGSHSGVAGVNTASGGMGVYGINRSSGDYGLLGGIAPDYNNDSYPAGVYGYDDSSGGGEGVKGYSLSGDGVEGDSDSGEAVIGQTRTGLAGHFYGDVEVGGTLSAGAKDFKIDHPLDPANRYLSHASVESDKMEDIYNGHVLLDANGAATVTLPNWFGALNTDFEYHLTPIGAPGPNLYIAQEIANNKFQIAGGQPGMKVSWQVTGVRHDAFALAHPLQVEQDKPEREKGLYQNPEAFGQPESMGISSLHGLKSKPQPKE